MTTSSCWYGKLRDITKTTCETVQPNAADHIHHAPCPVPLWTYAVTGHGVSVICTWNDCGGPLSATGLPSTPRTYPASVAAWDGLRPNVTSALSPPLLPPLLFPAVAVELWRSKSCSTWPPVVIPATAKASATLPPMPAHEKHVHVHVGRLFIQVTPHSHASGLGGETKWSSVRCHACVH